MQNIFKSKIFTRQFITYLLIMCITFIAISYVLLVRTRQSLEKQQMVMIENYRKDSANLLLGWLNREKSDIKKQALYLSNLNDEEMKSEKVTDLIKKQVSWNNGFYDILILDAKGNVINSANGASKINLSGSSYFVKGIIREDAVTEIYKSADNGVTLIAIGEPILIGKKPKYVLVGMIPMENVDSFVQSLEFGGWGNAYLVDQNGMIISENSNPQKYKSNRDIAANEGVKAPLKTIEEIKNKKVDGGMYKDDDGNSVFGTYQWINDFQAGLVVEIKGSYLLKPVDNLITAIIALAVIIILAGVILALGVNLNIVKPINELIDVTENIINGDYKSPIEIKTGSEIDALVTSFNKMQKVIEIRKIELEKKNEALKEQNLEAIEASRLKSEFLANMSHELRTPLNSIIGFSTRVIKKSIDILPKQQLENLSIVKEQAYHLLNLINDLLDFSKIEAGKMEVYSEEFNLEEVIEETSNMIKVLIEGKPIEYKVELCSKRTIKMYSDRLKVKQILINILSNAIKYSESGTIELRAQELDNMCIISVRDQGIGIAEENLDKIFEEFRQIDGSYTRKVGGTGLGLSITKRFVDMLGGNIGVESKLGVGSCFTIILPMNNVQLKLREKGIENSKTEKIICIDDDSNILRLYKEYLNDNNYNVLCLNGTEDVLHIIEENKPDLVISDIILPNKDGWEILAYIKNNDATKNIPVIMVSVLNEKNLAYKMYADDYLVKPITQEELIGAINCVLAASKEMQR